MILWKQLSLWRTAQVRAPQNSSKSCFFFLFFLKNSEFSRNGEIKKLQNWCSARRWEQPEGSRPRQRQSSGQPDLLSPSEHPVPAGRATSDRNNPETRHFEPLASRTGFDSWHVPGTHVPTVRARWSAPCVCLHRLHAASADLPGAPEGSRLGGISAPGALDPRWDHDPTLARLQL